MEERIASAVIDGLAQGVPYFLAASGFTLVFGVLGVLNLAHGAFIMLGSYVLTTVLGGNASSVPMFLIAIVIAALATGAVSAATEKLAFTRIYSEGREALIGLLLSFGLLLLGIGIVTLIWGPGERSQTAPTALNHHVVALKGVVSTYALFLLALGCVTAAGLYLLVRHTKFGKMMLAVSYDRTMASALGISVARVSLGTFAIAGMLAGIAGAVIGPLGAIDTDLANAYLLYAFVAIIIGGLGNIPGALLGSIVIGLVDSFLVTFAPSMEPFSLYLAAGAVLLVRPQGLFPAPTFVRAA
jgi:branched-chain amino acid transport system permease protein